MGRGLRAGRWAGPGEWEAPCPAATAASGAAGLFSGLIGGAAGRHAGSAQWRVARQRRRWRGRSRPREAARWLPARRRDGLSRRGAADCALPRSRVPGAWPCSTCPGWGSSLRLAPCGVPQVARWLARCRQHRPRPRRRSPSPAPLLCQERTVGAWRDLGPAAAAGQRTRLGWLGWTPRWACRSPAGQAAACLRGTAAARCGDPLCEASTACPGQGCWRFLARLSRRCPGRRPAGGLRACSAASEPPRMQSRCAPYHRMLEYGQAGVGEGLEGPVGLLPSGGAASVVPRPPSSRPTLQRHQALALRLAACRQASQQRERREEPRSGRHPVPLPRGAGPVTASSLPAARAGAVCWHVALIRPLAARDLPRPLQLQYATRARLAKAVRGPRATVPAQTRHPAPLCEKEALCALRCLLEANSGLYIAYCTCVW
jgi:hypothetical protein